MPSARAAPSRHPFKTCCSLRSISASRGRSDRVPRSAGSIRPGEGGRARNQSTHRRPPGPDSLQIGEPGARVDDRAGAVDGAPCQQQQGDGQQARGQSNGNTRLIPQVGCRSGHKDRNDGAIAWTSRICLDRGFVALVTAGSPIVERLGAPVHLDSPDTRIPRSAVGYAAPSQVRIASIWCWSNPGPTVDGLNPGPR
jgi:hypothetical protein